MQGAYLLRSFHGWAGIIYKVNVYLRWFSGIYAENTLTWHDLRWIYAEIALKTRNRANEERINPADRE